jgi:hypothetical protein
MTGRERNQCFHRKASPAAQRVRSDLPPLGTLLAFGAAMIRHSLVLGFGLALLGCSEDGSPSGGTGGTSGSAGSSSGGSAGSAGGSGGTAGTSGTGGSGGSGGSGAAGSGGTAGSSGGSGGSGGTGGTTPIPSCPSATALDLPDVEQERATYRAWGFTWSPDAEPNYPGEPGYVVEDPDIHGDTEGDDLWTYLHQYRRTQQKGYLDRATAWAAYFKHDYRACVGGGSASFCYDKEAFGADHLWGWGLVAWAAAMSDPAALTEAEALGDELIELYGPNTTFGCLPKGACVYYGLRQPGRHLLLATRLAEATSKPKFVELRDQIIELILGAEEWDAARGTYFLGDYGTNEILGAGAWEAGARIQSPFMIGVFTEALGVAYQTTGRAELRERLIAMARFVDQYGLDPTYDYTGSEFGIVDGKVFHNYGAEEPVTFWDPVYTTALVNTLVRGCILAGDGALCNRAKHFFARGNRGIYGEPTQANGGPTEIHHFVDTRFDTSTGSFFLDYNKGELQYTYLLFDPCVRDRFTPGP